MIQGILGKKIGMTRIFIDGIDTSVTVIKAGDVYVTQRKTKENDGYEAVQIGIGEKKEKRTSKALSGHFKKAGCPSLYHVKELKGDSLEAYKPGDKIAAGSVFKVGDFVDVSGKSKGKGFAGVVRRYHFAGGKRTHGSMMDRAPGSIGSSSYPSRVFKGMKMGGHMGARFTTIQNLKVVGIKEDGNILLVDGAVPGAIGAVIMVKKAFKK